LNPPSKNWKNLGTLQEFKQEKKFSAPGLKEDGYLYYPSSCKTKECNLHISLHDCGNGQESWVTENTRLLEYAATNDLIVLFPMAD